MKWENLQTNTCPHCGHNLVQPDEGEREVTCTSCRFHIDVERFKSIVEHRRTSHDTAVKMKWQYLLQARCPICQNRLRDSEGKFAIQRCVDASCTFKIRNDLLDKILGDPEHPANRFKTRL